jgi:hypothetical protein
MKEGCMNLKSIEFIYKAVNAIASGKHSPETEQCLSDVIAEELLIMNASLVLKRSPNMRTLQAEAHVAHN